LVVVGRILHLGVAGRAVTDDLVGDGGCLATELLRWIEDDVLLERAQFEVPSGGGARLMSSRVGLLV
jgi:hypothetical protein